MFANALQTTNSVAPYRSVLEPCAATGARTRAGEAQTFYKLQTCLSRRGELGPKLRNACRFCGWRGSHLQTLLRSSARLSKPRATVPTAQAAQADSSQQDVNQQNSRNKAGVLSALQGVKAENSFVIAVFLKILLLGSSGSIVAAKLSQSGYGHSVGALQGLSIVPVAIGIFVLTRYILQHRLHLRRGFAWGIFLGGVALLFLSHRYSALQRKYAVAPAPPVAHMAPRVTREQHSRLRALPTAEDADKLFKAYHQSQGDTEVDREWRNKKS